MQNSTPRITRTDFYLVSFIGVSFALFAIPILTNLNIPFISITPLFVVLLVVFFTIFANIALALAWLLSKKLPVVFQFAKFGAVGAFNTFFDWGVFSLLMVMTGIDHGIAISLFKGISFVAAVSGAYFWNKYWTFNAKDNTSSNEVARFALVSLTGFVINVGLTSLIVFTLVDTTIVTPAQLAQLAAALATFASLVWNFFGYKLFVFNK